MKIVKEKEANLKEVAKLIRRGGVVVCPTDTVYGLICDAANKKAIEMVFRIKKRDGNKPLPLFVKDFKMAKQIAKISKKQEKFLKSVWPGKITAILLPLKKLPKGIGKTKKEIGLRMVDCAIVNDLLKIINSPLTATSANISGEPPSTKIKEVISRFSGQKNKPDLVIDKGNLPKNNPSKIIDLTVYPSKILRP